MPRLNYSSSAPNSLIPHVSAEPPDLFTPGPTARWAYRYGSGVACARMMNARLAATGRISHAWANGTQIAAVAEVAEELVDLTAQGHDGLICAVDIAYAMYRAHAGMRAASGDIEALWRAALARAIEATDYHAPYYRDSCRKKPRITVVRQIP